MPTHGITTLAFKAYREAELQATLQDLTAGYVRDVDCEHH